MQINKKNAVVASLIALSGFSFFAKEKLPVVEIQGNQYYVYEAKKNQTFFNIASEFNWNVEELMHVNSKVTSPLAKGTKVYYPCNVESQKANFSNIQESDIEAISHLVKKGETVYSLANLYHVPVEQIYKLNPGSRDGIKAGEILQIRNATVLTPTGDNPQFYVVKKGDTLYQLARTFNTTVASILSTNPGISDKNFMAGTTIKVPAKGEGIKSETKKVEESKVVGFSSYKVSKEDTWASISEKTGVSVDDLKNANNGTEKLKNNLIIGVPDVVTDSVYRTVVTEDPREFTIIGVNEIYEDVHGIIPEDSVRPVLRIGIVMAEPSSRKDLDFTRGFLTGVNNLKGGKYNINVKLFDATIKPDALIDSLENYNATMLFTTYEKNTPKFFSDYAMVSKTPIVNTFDLKDENYLTNPYFINILTPSNYFNDEVANSLANRYKGSRLVIVGADSDASDLLVNAIQEKWDDSKVTIVSSIPEYQALPVADGEKYMVFGNVNKKEDIALLSKEIEERKNNNVLSDFVFIGRPNWVVYDETLRDNFVKSGVLIPARFYYDKASSEALKFQNEYNNVFKMTPVKSFPMYSTMGYDEALYFIPSLFATGGDLNEFKPSSTSVQSDFELLRPANWSGIVNPCIYLLKFCPEKVEKIKVK